MRTAPTSARLGIQAALLFFALTTIASASTLQSTLGTGWFVQGMTGVTNDFVVENPPIGTLSIIYRWYNPQTNSEITQRLDANPSNGWAQGVDMGDMIPGTHVIAYCIGLLDTLAVVGPLPLQILDRPDWMIEGTATAVAVQPNQITFAGFAPIDGIVDGIVDPSVTGFGKRRVQILRLGAKFTGRFDCASRQTTTSPPAIQIGIDIFRQGFALRDISTDATVAMDTNFNLAFTAEDSIAVPLFKITLPKIYIPIASIADIQVDVGARFSARLKGRVVFGESDGQWGFIRHNDQATTLAAFLDCHGWFRGSLNIFWGIVASARGTINLYGTLGAGIEYTSIPASSVDTKFGGSFRITGEASASILFWDVWSVGPTELYSGSFGTMPGKTVATSPSPLLRASTVALNRAFLTPTYDPRPLLCTNGDDLGIVWSEQSPTASTLFISRMQKSASAFPSPVRLSLPTGITNTSATMFPDGTTLVAYATSRYTSTTSPADLPIVEAIRAMDIEYCLVSPTGTIQRYSLPDDRTSLQSGRADGMPAVCMLNADSALLVWSVLRPMNAGTELWYSTISIRDGNSTSPLLLTTASGSHYSHTVTSAGNGQAIVAWVMDPDTTLTTGGKWIVHKLLQQGRWGPTTTIPTSGGNVTAVQASGAGRYSALSWFEQIIDSSDAITSRVVVRVFDASTGMWNNGDAYVADDPDNDFRNLSIAINEQGNIALGMIRVPWDIDTSSTSQGRSMIIANYGTQNEQWHEQSNLPYLSDTTRYVWQSQIALRSAGDLSLLTEEHGGGKDVLQGIRIGDPNAGIVLRMMHLQTDGTVIDSEEPAPPTTSTPMQQEQLTNLHLYPNPTTGITTLRFSVPSSTHLSIEVVDVLGQSIGTVISADIESGVYESRLDLSQLPRGYYHAVIRTSNGVQYAPLEVR